MSFHFFEWFHCLLGETLMIFLLPHNPCSNPPCLPMLISINEPPWVLMNLWMTSGGYASRTSKAFSLVTAKLAFGVSLYLYPVLTPSSMLCGLFKFRGYNQQCWTHHFNWIQFTMKFQQENPFMTSSLDCHLENWWLIDEIILLWLQLGHATIMAIKKTDRWAFCLHTLENPRGHQARGTGKCKMGWMMMMICTGKLPMSGPDHLTWVPKLGSPVATATTCNTKTPLLETGFQTFGFSILWLVCHHLHGTNTYHDIEQ